MTILLQTYMYTTKTTEGLLHSDDQVKEKDLNLGDWVVVVFDQTRYPGQGVFCILCTYIDQEPRIQVKVMHQSWSGTRKLWKWPEGKSHEVFYFTENVVQKIGLPIHTTQRADTFTFDKDMKCKLYPPKMYTCIRGNTWGLTVFKFKWFTDKAK